MEKSNHLKMYLLLKMLIFQCQVSFQGCCNYRGNVWWTKSCDSFPLTLEMLTRQTKGGNHVGTLKRFAEQSYFWRAMMGSPN